MEIFKIVTLSISGLLLFMVGLFRLSQPLKTFLKNSGIELNNDVNLLNEIRGLSALMMFGGLTIMLGTIWADMRMSSFVVASLIFLGFALGRITSMSLDGKPNKLLVQGLVSELVLGLANLICLVSAYI